MNFNNLFSKISKEIKQDKKIVNKNSFNKPVKTKKISGKTVKIFNNNPIPKKQTIKKVYDKIPDDTNIPLKFMTREQYLNQYVDNQEKKHGKKFSVSQRSDYVNSRKKAYKNITGRYTTKNNPYYKPAVVVFNDNNNSKNIKGDEFKKFAWHEYGHEFIEKEGIKLNPDLEEDFCDYLAHLKVEKKDKRTPKKILKEYLSGTKQQDFNKTRQKCNKAIKKDVYSKDKFTPFRNPQDAEEMSASRRFGGRNLQGLQRIGEGRDRTVYALDDDKVVKVAKNPGGLSQNISEQDIEYLEMGEQVERGKDYVVMKRQRPLSREGKRRLDDIRKEVDEEGLSTSPGYNTQVAASLSKEDSSLQRAGITNNILDFQPNPQEVFANRQWGEDEQGNLVLLDGGALQDNQRLSRYRVKDYKPSDWEYQDWKDVQSQRRQFRDKGNFDLNRKQYRGTAENPEGLQNL